LRRQSLNKEKDELQEPLTGYKEKVAPVTKGTLTWDKELIFVGRTQRGYEIEYDAEIQWGCAPTESLLLSLAACMGIDMVSFLQKMRSKLTGFKIDIAGERNPTPPQYYKSIEMVLHMTGENITPKQVEKAIALSQDKYCSVYHSLRKDLKVTVKYFISEGLNPGKS
jgi:putative redox protein